MIEVSEGIELKHCLLLVLRTGQENAIKGKHLAELLKEHDTRSIRLAIDELIENGYPICSSPHSPYGYFIAASPEEANESLAILRSYGKNLFRHYRNLKRARDKAFGDDRERAGQLNLF